MAAAILGLRIRHEDAHRRDKPRGDSVIEEDGRNAVLAVPDGVRRIQFPMRICL